jgi:hypothetical protein
MPVKITEMDQARADGILLGHMEAMRHVVALTIASERERCAQIAEGLNGWGSKKSQPGEIAEHIAKVIRRLGGDVR